MLTWLTRFPRLNSTRLGLLLTLIMLVFFWLDDAHETGKTFMVAPLVVWSCSLPTCAFGCVVRSLPVLRW